MCGGCNHLSPYSAKLDEIVCMYHLLHINSEAPMSIRVLPTLAMTPCLPIRVIPTLGKTSCLAIRVTPETKYSTVCIKLSRGGVNRFYAFYPIFRVSQSYEFTLKII